MELKDQVVSLELAKKLKELGFPQDKSLFYWNGKELVVRTALGFSTLGCEGPKGEPDWYDEMEGGKLISAYTIAELEQWMPTVYQVIKTESDYWMGAKEMYSLHQERKSWMFTKSGELRQGLPDWMFDVLGGSGAGGKKHADVLAMIFIYLEKNNLIKEKS